MCTQFHQDSYLGKMFSELEKMIALNHEKVGEIIFISHMPPRLAHLELLESHKREALLNNAMGFSLIFLYTRYSREEKKDNAEMALLLASIFDKPITPRRFAKLILDMAKTVASELKTAGKDGAIKILKTPSDTDFGSKRIYFNILHMVLELVLSSLMENKEYEHYFSAKEKNVMNFFKFAAEWTEKPPDSALN